MTTLNASRQHTLASTLRVMWRTTHVHFMLRDQIHHAALQIFSCMCIVMCYGAMYVDVVGLVVKGCIPGLR